ncbi:MAG: hypothetical protein V3U35_08840 [Candidatus Neomarinimicrobiota bacterium]
MALLTHFPKVLETLRTRPAIGMAGSLGASLMALELWLRIAGVAVGLAIGLVTLIIKLKELNHD